MAGMSTMANQASPRSRSESQVISGHLSNASLRCRCDVSLSLSSERIEERSLAPWALGSIRKLSKSFEYSKRMWQQTSGYPTGRHGSRPKKHVGNVAKRQINGNIALVPTERLSVREVGVTSGEVSPRSAAGCGARSTRSSGSAAACGGSEKSRP